MRPSHGFPAKALTWFVLAGVLAAGPAFAQFYDPTVEALGLSSDVSRSPRLTGLGGLSLVVPDHYQRFTLWDFAHIPVGLSDAESTSTLDLRPGSNSTETAYDMVPGLVRPEGGFRQDVAGRSAGMPFELMHRDANGNTYGAYGTFAGVHDDRPFSDDVETRTSVSHPEVRPVLAGPLPWFGKGRVHYALDLQFGKEQQRREYRAIVKNAGGDFITLDGETVLPPDLFQPLDVEVRTIGIGGSLSYPLFGLGTMAIGIQERGDRFTGTDDRNRSSSEINESRPTDIGQAALVGHLGKSLEYGIDGRAWRANSQQNWVFTISSGSGVVPLSGRGKLLEREERGTALNNRARWTTGPFALGGQLWTRWSKVKITPPGADDASSLNRFLAVVYERVGADTLALPDSIVANEQEDHAWGYGAGASWAYSRGIAGVEYHWARDRFDQDFGGAGPFAKSWEVRSGLEYRCSPVVTGRIGGGFGWFDQNELILGDEWNTRSATLGLGVRPRNATWWVDLGYSLSWLTSDYPDPLDHRGTRQRLESIIHWGL